MADIEKTIKELKDGLDFKIYDRTCVLLDVSTVSNALELLKEQKAYEWHFIKFRKPTDEEKEYYKEEYGEYNDGDADEIQVIENVPADGEEVLLWTWCGFTVDTYNDGMFEGAGEIGEGMAWRYLEEPKEGEKE